MRTKFPEYYRPNSDELSKLFDNCLFAFDTNALLDIFRLGEDIASKVIDLLKDFHKQIVIPYHVAEEFHKDYLEVICGELAIGREAVKLLDDTNIKQLLGEEFLAKIPRCIRKDFVKSLEAVFTRYRNLQNERNEYLDCQKESGQLLRSVADLLGDVMLDGFSSEELESIYSQGEQRYKKQIPPGYKDKNKKDNQYGDLIIWNEILREAKKQAKSVIFISNDLKEDWIQTYHGMKCGPRIELLKEFQNEVPGNTFYTYSLEKFITYANEKKQSLKNKEMEMIQVILRDVQEPISTIKLNKDKQDAKAIGDLKQDDLNVTLKKGMDIKSSNSDDEAKESKSVLKGEAHLFEK